IADTMGFGRTPAWGRWTALLVAAFVVIGGVVPVISLGQRHQAPSPSDSAAGVPPVRALAVLALVVGRHAVADGAALPHRTLGPGRRALEMGGELLGELAQQAADQRLFLRAEEAPVGVGHDVEAGADDLDVVVRAFAGGDAVEVGRDLPRPELARR